MVAWLLLTAVTVALAELYSEVVGAETRKRHRVDADHVEWARSDRLYGYWAARFPGARRSRAPVQGALVAAVGGPVVVVTALLD